ncbi:hypothetical protein [Pseudooceanicola sp. MF1-13]
MTRFVTIIALVALAALVAACGVDGEPEKPEATPEPGITVSGRAAVGVMF